MKTLAFLALAVSTVSLSRAEFENFQEAASVLGQSALDVSYYPLSTSERDFKYPQGLAFDKSSGKRFLVDNYNSRILRFSSEEAYRTHGTAEAAFGQPNLESDLRPTVHSASTVSNPMEILLDDSGTLWLADARNHHILRFDNAATRANGSSADAVIGQPDFSTVDAPSPDTPDATSIYAPVGLAMDSQGSLWVSDIEANRILRFDDAATLHGKVAADGVLGQFDFTNIGSSLSRSGFYNPAGIRVDSRGTLWVADYGNHRVLRFDNAHFLENGADADGVLGQPGFDTAVAERDSSSMNISVDVELSADGTLWVTDYGNSRVLGFRNAHAKENGADADIVLGQADFTSKTEEIVSARAVNSPNGLALGPDGSLFVTDFQYHRALRFQPIPDTPMVDREFVATLIAVLGKRISKVERFLRRAKRKGNDSRTRKLKRRMGKLKRRIRAI